MAIPLLRRGLKLPLAAIVYFVCFGIPAWADVTIVQSVNIEIHGRLKTVERQLLLKQNRLRIGAVSENQHTATIIDLDAHTITQVDLMKRSGIVYSIVALRDFVNRSATGTINASVKPASGMATIAGSSCSERSFNLSIPAFRDTNSRLVGSGSACLAKEGPANNEYAAFLSKAMAEGVVVNYLGDNGLLLALAREQTELYRLLGAYGGIPLNVDLSTHFEGGLIGRMWNIAASHSVMFTKSVSTAPVPSTAIDIPPGIALERKDH